jgi:ComF family protein
MNFIYNLWDDFLCLLFPRLCYGCGNHLLRNEKIICIQCYISIPRTNYHLLPDNPVEQLFWGRCEINKAAAFSFYNRGSRIRKLIHNLKYKGIKEIGEELGRIYGHNLKESDFLNGIDILIPIPLHSSRLRKRGFNQSELICRGIGEASGLFVDNKSVVRAEKSDTQTSRSRIERWMNVEGIFNISKPENLKGKHILLVDDVITTGSTIDACATELLKIDGVKVSVVALAVAMH